jgi:hypothetical protein
MLLFLLELQDNVWHCRHSFERAADLLAVAEILLRHEDARLQIIRAETLEEVQTAGETAPNKPATSRSRAKRAAGD